jgi:hypothetical protein
VQGFPRLLHPCRHMLLMALVASPCPMRPQHWPELEMLLLLLLSCPKLLAVLLWPACSSQLRQQQRRAMVRSLPSHWLSCLLTGVPCRAWEGAARVRMSPSPAQLLPGWLPQAAACNVGHAAVRCCGLLLGLCRQGGR